MHTALTIAGSDSSGGAGVQADLKTMLANGVFELTAEPEATKVYLSRPWRPYAQAVFIRCELGKHILPIGWNNWGKKENEKTVFYAEYESRGEGANPKARAAFSQQLKNLKGYEINAVLAGEDGWNPIENGNKLTTVKR